jgi:hypothetical protein
MKKRELIALTAVLLLAGVLTFFKIPLASSQGITLAARYIEDPLPVTDPDSDLWRKSQAVDIPLSAQQIARPMLLESRTRSVTARFLHNNEELAVLLEWSDLSQDGAVVRVQDFRDMAALQFPLTEGQPFFCMGQSGGNVNIWLWKADWQADIASRSDVETFYPDMYVDMYPFTDPDQGAHTSPANYTDPNYLPGLQAGNLFSLPVRYTPVENLVAGGFGSLTPLPHELQHVQGYGTWENGKWRVIYSRSLDVDTSGEVSLSPGKTYPVAFAVWDGANYERGAQKSTSQWVSLEIKRSPIPAAASQQFAAAEIPFWRLPETIMIVLVGVFVFLFIIGAVIFKRLPN